MKRNSVVKIKTSRFSIKITSFPSTVYLKEALYVTKKKKLLGFESEFIWNRAKIQQQRFH